MGTRGLYIWTLQQLFVHKAESMPRLSRSLLSLSSSEQIQAGQILLRVPQVCALFVLRLWLDVEGNCPWFCMGANDH